MQVTVARQGEVAVLAVHGEVDAATSAVLRGELETLLTQGQQDFVVDLQDCAFLDSSGLATLVHVFKRVRIGNGDVRLAQLQPAVEQLFRLTRLDRVFEVFPTSEQAVQSFPAAGGDA